MYLRLYLMCLAPKPSFSLLRMAPDAEGHRAGLAVKLYCARLMIRRVRLHSQVPLCFRAIHICTLDSSLQARALPLPSSPPLAGSRLGGTISAHTSSRNNLQGAIYHRAARVA